MCRHVCLSCIGCLTLQSRFHLQSRRDSTFPVSHTFKCTELLRASVALLRRLSCQPRFHSKLIRQQALVVEHLYSNKSLVFAISGAAAPFAAFNHSFAGFLEFNSQKWRPAQKRLSLKSSSRAPLRLPRTPTALSHHRQRRTRSCRRVRAPALSPTPLTPTQPPSRKRLRSGQYVPPIYISHLTMYLCSWARMLTHFRLGHSRRFSQSRTRQGRCYCHRYRRWQCSRLRPPLAYQGWCCCGPDCW